MTMMMIYLTWRSRRFLHSNSDDRLCDEVYGFELFLKEVIQYHIVCGLVLLFFEGANSYIKMHNRQEILIPYLVDTFLYVISRRCIVVTLVKKAFPSSIHGQESNRLVPHQGSHPPPYLYQFPSTILLHLHSFDS